MYLYTVPEYKKKKCIIIYDDFETEIIDTVSNHFPLWREFNNRACKARSRKKNMVLKHKIVLKIWRVLFLRNFTMNQTLKN